MPRTKVLGVALLLTACSVFDEDLEALIPAERTDPEDAGTAPGDDDDDTPDPPGPPVDAGSRPDADASPPPCEGPHLRTRENRCYRFNPSRTTWEQAEAQCVTWGGHLVSVHSSPELDFLRSLVEEEEAATPASTGVWIGFNSKGRAVNDFVWSDGSNVEYTNWAQSEPDVAAEPKECVYQYREQFVGHWDNFKCSVQAESICARAR